MELSLVNDIDDDEVIDIDIAGNEGDVLIESTSSFTRDIFTTDSLFIVIYEEDGEYIDKLLIVDEISDEQDKILLKDENENDEFLYFDTNDILILKNLIYSSSSRDRSPRLRKNVILKIKNAPFCSKNSVTENQGA